MIINCAIFDCAKDTIKSSYIDIHHLPYNMDRTMYGKVDPGARQPFRCAVRERGLLPGCKWGVVGRYILNVFCIFYLDRVVQQVNRWPISSVFALKSSMAIWWFVSLIEKWFTFAGNIWYQLFNILKKNII